VITHNHIDHVLFETFLRLRYKVGAVIVPRDGGTLQHPSLRLLLQHIGFRNVMELDEMECVTFEDGSITALPFLCPHGRFDRRHTSFGSVQFRRHVLTGE
jgi:L-ascorbate metabolism protein UlaG (beta-lactamase superfamily)